MAPKGKKRFSRAISDDSNEPTTKKARVHNSASQVDDKGEPYWELSKMRRVSVSEFKGKHMVNIREYYESDDKTLPGKKGITLTLEQYSALVEALPEIEKVLKSNGLSVPRPLYESGSSSSDRAHAQQDEDEEEEGDKNEEVVGKIKKESKKSNFEATSDEEEDDE